MSHAIDQVEPDLPEDRAERRDFLVLVAGAMGAVGAEAATWPPIDSMNLPPMCTHQLP